MLRNIFFKYPAQNRNVLKDIDLKIESGQVIALVGENGSGKTTLVKLLCRLYDPSHGNITIDGIDLKQFDLNVLRQNIGVLFQDYMHYNLTVRENIWIGNTNLDLFDERITKVAKDTGAIGAILKLNNGFDTNLGLRFGSGNELSIGEWQKIALARAFLRDAQIIILDEPTSSLDAKAERELFNSFRKLLQGKMGILISHRFTTVRMADYIYVLTEGIISEKGTHDDLIRKDGIYAKLFEIQAQNSYGQ